MARGRFRFRVRWRSIGRGLLAAAAVAFAALSYTWFTLPDVRALGRDNPRRTAFMEIRAAEAVAAGRQPRVSQQWISYRRVSPVLVRAVLVAEDAGFWGHQGIDLEEIRASMEINWEQGDLLRGASTITQQLAKNLYLSPTRNPYRKVRELFIARRLEAELPKARILELYLNLIEWGDGIWGAEAASQRYFGTSASALSADQAALLAGAIINPRRYSPASPNARLLHRQQLILHRMGAVTPPEPVPTLEVPVVPLPPGVLTGTGSEG